MSELINIMVIKDNTISENLPMGEIITYTITTSQMEIINSTYNYPEQLPTESELINIMNNNP